MITFVFLECNSSGDWPLVQEHENYSHCIHKQILFLIDKELVIPLEHDFFGCKYYLTLPIGIRIGRNRNLATNANQEENHELIKMNQPRARSVFFAMGLGEKPIQTDPTRKQSPAQEKTKKHPRVVRSEQTGVTNRVTVAKRQRILDRNYEKKLEKKGAKGHKID